jgi:hypothetical protein
MRAVVAGSRTKPANSTGRNITQTSLCEYKYPKLYFKTTEHAHNILRQWKSIRAYMDVPLRNGISSNNGHMTK